MSKVRNIEIPWTTLVRQNDPLFDQARRKELAYEFESFGGRRAFVQNPLASGAYADKRVFLTDEYGRLVTDENGGAIVIEGGN